VHNITDFGVFVTLEEGLDGLLHRSKLADHEVKDPDEVVSVGQELEVLILSVDPEERKISLALNQPPPPESPDNASDSALNTA
jgi:ribosomal protein S1